MNSLLLIPFFMGLVFLIPGVYAEKIIQNIEGGMDLEVSYPEEIVVGRDGIISVLVKNYKNQAQNGDPLHRMSMGIEQERVLLHLLLCMIWVWLPLSIQ